jgi:hypothetical protein
LVIGNCLLDWESLVEDKKAAAFQIGWYVFIGLFVLTLVEYWVSVSLN